MKELLPKIDSKDGQFHNGNPATGEQGTRVTDTWLNNVQAHLRDIGEELKFLLSKAGLTPIANKTTQIYEAIVAIINANRRNGSVSAKGEIQLTNDTGLDSEVLGLSAKGAKKLAQEISQNRINVTKSLNEKVDKTAVSDAVNSNSQTNVASSRAAKTAYDKAVDGVNRANNAQNTANDAVNRANNAQTKANQADNNANGRIPLSGDCEITGVKSFFGQLRIRSSGDLTKYARFGQNNNDTFIQNPYSGKYFQIRNDGSLRYDGNLIFVKGFQNPSWEDVENKPNLVEQSGSYAVLKPKDSGYAGMSIERTGNAGSWASRIEALPDKRWKFWVQNSHDIYLPVKSGTVALVEDLNEKFNHSVTDVRLGAETSRILGDPEWRSHGAGYVVTGFFNKTGDFNGNDVVWLRPIQKQIRGQWITVANA